MAKLPLKYLDDDNPTLTNTLQILSGPYKGKDVLALTELELVPKHKKHDTSFYSQSKLILLRTV